MTNIDNTQSLRAGERVKVTAQSPWVIEMSLSGGPTGDSDVAITSPDPVGVSTARTIAGDELPNQNAQLLDRADD